MAFLLFNPAVVESASVAKLDAGQVAVLRDILNPTDYHGKAFEISFRGVEDDQTN